MKTAHEAVRLLALGKLLEFVHKFALACPWIPRDCQCCQGRQERDHTPNWIGIQKVVVEMEKLQGYQGGESHVVDRHQSVSFEEQFSQRCQIAKLVALESLNEIVF